MAGSTRSKRQKAQHIPCDTGAIASSSEDATMVSKLKRRPSPLLLPPSKRGPNERQTPIQAANVMSAMTEDARESSPLTSEEEDAPFTVAMALAPQLMSEAGHSGQHTATIVTADLLPSNQNSLDRATDSSDDEENLTTWEVAKRLGLVKESVQANTPSQEEGGQADAMSILYPPSNIVLPPKCEVSDESIQSPSLRHIYGPLVPLGARTFIGWKKSEYAGEGRMIFDEWYIHCPNMDSKKAFKALEFVAYQRMVHLARSDPRNLAGRQTPYSSGGQGRLLTAGNSNAAIVSLVPIRVTDCCLQSPADNGRKYIAGIMHSQDMERFISVVCMVFGEKSVHCNLGDDVFVFETRGPAKSGSQPASPYKASKASTQSSHIKAVGPSPSTLTPAPATSIGYVKTTLAPTDEVSIYDGRFCDINWSSDLANLEKLLPQLNTDITPGSMAVVAHTVTTYARREQGAIVGTAINLNVQWVLLLGSPDQPEPVRRAKGKGKGKGKAASTLSDLA